MHCGATESGPFRGPMAHLRVARGRALGVCSRETSPAQLRRLLAEGCERAVLKEVHGKAAPRSQHFNLDYTQYSRPTKNSRDFKIPLFAFSEVEKLIMYVTGRGVVGRLPEMMGLTTTSASFLLVSPRLRTLESSLPASICSVIARGSNEFSVSCGRFS